MNCLQGVLRSCTYPITSKKIPRKCGSMEQARIITSRSEHAKKCTRINDYLALSNLIWWKVLSSSALDIWSQKRTYKANTHLEKWWHTIYLDSTRFPRIKGNLCRKMWCNCTHWTDASEKKNLMRGLHRLWHGSGRTEEERKNVRRSLCLDREATQYCGRKWT